MYGPPGTPPVNVMMLAGRGGGDGRSGGRLSFELPPPIRDVIGNLDLVTPCTITDDDVAQGLFVGVVVTLALVLAVVVLVGYEFVGANVVRLVVEPLVMPCF